MYKIKFTFVLIFLASLSLVQSSPAVEAQIVRMSGEVLVRRGVEETWRPVSLGIFIKDIDTILTGEKGEVVLNLAEGTTFVLGPNSILDISDLQQISERQLFLYLIKEKVNRVEKHTRKTELRLGKVSVVHGEKRDVSTASPAISPASWTPVINGALALYRQEYYPNAVIKLNKILDAGLPEERGCEVHFYLGRSFEAVHNPGQAIDAYQTVVDQCKEDENAAWTEPAREAIVRLKKSVKE